MRCCSITLSVTSAVVAAAARLIPLAARVTTTTAACSLRMHLIVTRRKASVPSNNACDPTRATAPYGR